MGKRRPSRGDGRLVVVAFSGEKAEGFVDQEERIREDAKPNGDARDVRRSADWKAARAYKESGAIYEGRVEGFNTGAPKRAIQDIAKDLVHSLLSVKVIQASEEDKQLIFSEKDALWSKYSGQVQEGDIFEAKVGSVEDYGAFIHLQFPDGFYHITGLVHVSEVSWDLVQDVRDFLNEGDDVRVKVIQVDREKSRITLSIKQLEDDPLLVTLDKVIQQDDQFGSDISMSTHTLNAEALPGLQSICSELLQEDGITDVKIGRQGLEKRAVSQDLELWLSNAPAKDNQYTLLARAGRQFRPIRISDYTNGSLLE
ncbi:hypothetical protein QJS04_geneDACA004392 [Acorus gramineus]|uniref:S1 motif domain-containing protein n=1 Tax=Acorus gramineus TaxID=55184 RepID=A0AAV9B522_ACOGR|nr:hypothetical protein QJS04_geneDACA004392 [Acorus gramineus]